ncbi:hypothetical protein AMELA_G00056570 [Ameiurus melas]|uniref:Uncharacterized protein n=1 Tax=Ameiurus melas TaxID=219545 RepID=A0A7J6B0W3_AMEME|nr:hypothetical protein AMELA_G00056570 [Ameiurus melas]
MACTPAALERNCCPRTSPRRFTPSDSLPYWRSRSPLPLDEPKSSAGTTAAPKAILLIFHIICVTFTFCVTQMRMGFPSESGSSQGFFLKKHLREFFLATVATQWLAQLG